MTKISRTTEELAKIQVELELSMKLSGIERFEANAKRATDQGEASLTPWNRKLIQERVQPLADALQIYLDFYKGRAGKPSKTLTYLRLLDVRQSAFIAMKVIFDSIGEDIPLTALVLKVAGRIEDQVRFSKLIDSAPKYMGKVEDSLRKSNTSNYNHKHKKYAIAEGSLKKDGSISAWRDWPDADKVQVGSKLLDIFMENVLFKGEPLLTKRVEGSKNSRTIYLDPHEDVKGWIEEYKSIASERAPSFGPCVIPPRPWVGPRNGGFHVKEVAETKPLIKTWKAKDASVLTKKQMPVVYKAVNALQAVKWTINDRILETVKHIKEHDLAIAIPQGDTFKAPVFPFDTELKGKALRDTLTEEELEALNTWKSDTKDIHDANRKRASQYIEMARTVVIAEQYSTYENLHYVYTLDFRGRIYACGADVSPQGGDLGKALVKFSEGCELGLKGRYWLAVQGANVWGEDKVSFDDRFNWSIENTGMILDCASDPMTFTDWTEADKPWQFLSFCFEWSDMCEHGDDKTFVSHIPVAMDGSCSGIQHYSAMLRDAVGGKAVNLVPSELPQDIYGEVANLTRRKLIDFNSLELSEKASDKEKLIKLHSQELLSVNPENGKNLVNRDMCKKPVMTLPYGSSQQTCLKSITEYLSDKGAWYSWQGNRSHAEQAVSTVIWQSIGEVVIAARDAMSFIRKVASVHAKHNKGMSWTTPTGFIVHQEAFETKSFEVKTSLMGCTKLSLTEETDKIDNRKMQNSAPPNFIHSMDASHLTFAVSGFEDNKISSIAVVHDSFGTHAGKTEELRGITLTSFVDMYEENDVIEDLLLECEEALGCEIDVERPDKGDLDLKDVTSSLYCFG